MQTTLEHRYQSGLTVLASYTWAHSLDNESTLRNDPKIEYGNSFLDLRHRFTFLGDYSLPFGRGSKGLGAKLARDWGINVVAVLTTGLPFDITNSAARSNTGGSDRPNVVCDPTSGFQQSVFKWFNTSCFAAQPLYSYGIWGEMFCMGPDGRTLIWRFTVNFLSGKQCDSSSAARRSTSQIPRRSARRVLRSVRGRLV